MTATVEMVGGRFGRWTVLRRVPRPANAKDTAARWLCRCSCGTERVVPGGALRSGESKSCGCLLGDLNRAGATHGRCVAVHKNGDRSYMSWRNMRDRCLNPKASGYPHYGGRGIRICDRWMNDFDAFVADMGERPVGHTLDRIDPNGNYEPGNCRWATPREQALNRRPCEHCGMPTRKGATMLKPKPSQEGGAAVEVDDEDEDEPRYDDEQPLFDPDEAGR